MGANRPLVHLRSFSCFSPLGTSSSLLLTFPLSLATSGRGGKFSVKDVQVEQVEVPNEYGSWVVKFSIEESPAVNDGEGVQVEGGVKPSVEFVLCSPAVRQVALCIGDAIVRAMGDKPIGAPKVFNGTATYKFALDMPFDFGM